MRNRLLVAGLLFLMSFALPEKKKIKVWLIGDSTMANKEAKAFPETGWGMPFAKMFDASVTVDNRAKNGRSTKSFIEEGLWKNVIDSMKEGDYVFIQFGHNDEVKEKVGRYTTPDEFKANLTRYVTETRNKKGIPILLTPVARRKFDEAGKVKETHAEYSTIVRNVAAALKVPLIDLDKKSQALLQSFGPERSKELFLHLAPGQYANFPEGKTDDTHFSEMGAKYMASIVLGEIVTLKLELGNRVPMQGIQGAD